MTMIEKYMKIADHYGSMRQLIVLMEECGELTQASSKVFRYVYDLEDDYEDDIFEGDDIELPGDLYDSITEEIADVIIMIEQIKYLLEIEDDDIKAWINMKVNRELERIAESENNDE